MVLSVFRYEGVPHWGDASAAVRRPHPLSVGYRTHAEATVAAVQWARHLGLVLEGLTGVADRKVAAEMGVRWLDPRGGASMGGKVELRLRLRGIWSRIQTGHLRDEDDFVAVMMAEVDRVCPD